MKNLKKITRLTIATLLTAVMLLMYMTPGFAVFDSTGDDGADVYDLDDTGGATVTNNTTDVDNCSNSKSVAYTSSPSEIFKIADIPSELYEMRYSVSDEILAESTEKLLEYFLESIYLREIIHGEGLFSSFGLYEKFIESVDLSEHKAFRELISREDFMQTLEKYAKDLLTSSGFDEDAELKLQIILRQDSVSSKLSEVPKVSDVYPNLNAFYLASTST